jgi:large subunit ribosomal protein L18
MNRLELKRKRHQRRRLRIRERIGTSPDRPRLCVYRSNKNFYAQIIDDSQGFTMVAASTLEKDFPAMKNRGNVAAAKILGKIIAERAQQKGITGVVFDRSGYLYHGKVKAFADAARENGLAF